MTAAFEPVGERARWEVVYELLIPLTVGEVLTYDVMGEALGLDTRSRRHLVQEALRRAAKEYLVRDKRDLKVVPNLGYRVIDPAAQMEVARSHQRKARRSLKRGHSHVVNVDFRDVAPEDRQAIELLSRAIGMQIDFNRRFEAKQLRLESLVDSLGTQTQQDRELVARQVAELRDRIARLEHTADG